jgi:formylglycine-generating enzyme required for sulfatase activity
VVHVPNSRGRAKQLIGWLGVVTSVMLLASACSFDRGSAQIACETTDDCPEDSVCENGTCVVDENAWDVFEGDAGDDSGTEDAEVDSTDADASDDVDGTDGGDDCIDGDNDGFFAGDGCTEPELDCDDSDDTVYPGAEEVCDGVDNDCDGSGDPDTCVCRNGDTRTCGQSEGACVPGAETCEDGQWGSCEGATGPETEVCDGADNDCDGSVDEGVCECNPGESRDCGSDVGACELGTQNCENGQWGSCQGGESSSAEVCDGVDNDCDGTVDNNLTDVGGTCSTGQDGICASGTYVCDNSGTRTCQPDNQPADEVCDGVDNDCDGTVDENPTDVGGSCTTQLQGVCADGTTVCNSGQPVCEQDEQPSPELCNNRDDDCDGDVDEVYPQAGQTCSTGQPGVCSDGELQCNAGIEECVPLQSPSSETCDGLDSDCDGLVDEDLSGITLTRACGNTCPGRGVEICRSGQWGSCENRGVEICDGVDNNCDTQADNQAICYAACPGGGTAVGTLACTASGPDCVLPSEICGDSTDNDCDGQVDENCGPAASKPLVGMVYVAGGSFLMGSDPNATGTQTDETPQHLVELDPFYIDREEVSGGDFEACANAGACTVNWSCVGGLGFLPSNWRSLPTTCISYTQASDYCAWQGKRLPTEAEWEKAARGPYPRDQYYPWGDSTITQSRAVYDCTNGYDNCVDETDTYTSWESYYGTLHQAGNIGELVSDYYDANFYTSSYTVNPEQTTDMGAGRVVRGGSYDEGYLFLRLTNRAATSFGNVGDDEIGFRCAKDAP